MVDIKRPFELSVGLTVVSLGVTEFATHALKVDATVANALLFLSLVPVAYGALRAGFLAGVVDTGLVALYAVHFAGPHRAFLADPGASMRAFALMAFLGFAMSGPMSIIRRRETQLGLAVKQRTEDIQRRNEELTELNSALEAFGYVVSHDLKEPVRAIANYLHAAREDFPGGESKRYVEEAYTANMRLAAMLQGLLEYSRASSAPAAPIGLDVEEAIRGEPCRTQYGRYFQERNVALELERGIPKVRGDRVLLSHLFGNLLLNAARHNRNDKPVVRIAWRPAPTGRVHLTVGDNGNGFPPEVLARFSEIPPTGISTLKGGFGLVIAQRSARRLEGRLWLENAATGGAVAHVELPEA